MNAFGHLFSRLPLIAWKSSLFPRCTDVLVLIDCCCLRCTVSWAPGRCSPQSTLIDGCYFCLGLLWVEHQAGAQHRVHWLMVFIFVQVYCELSTRQVLTTVYIDWWLLFLFRCTVSWAPGRCSPQSTSPASPLTGVWSCPRGPGTTLQSPSSSWFSGWLRIIRIVFCQ